MQLYVNYRLESCKKFSPSTDINYFGLIENITAKVTVLLSFSNELILYLILQFYLNILSAFDSRYFSLSRTSLKQLDIWLLLPFLG